MDRLKEDFFALPATDMAPKLLGKYLCRKLLNGGIIRKKITETECYYGFDDTASHASRGKTPRNAVMFGAGGAAYIYLCYGVHEMLNIVSGAEGHPEAVLLRGIEGAAGPGKLTKLLSINRSFNSENLITSGNLWLEGAPEPQKILAAPRIGIDYAAQKDRERLWRFFIDDK